MNQMMRNAALGAGTIMANVVGQLVDESRAISTEDAVARYAREHRGKPEAIAQFAAQHAPPGTNPFVAGAAYERAMEAQLKTKR